MADAVSPQRTCVGCRTVSDAAALTRFVLVGTQLTRDASGRSPGRGAWLHMDAACVEQARKRGAFARSFHRRVDDAVLDELLAELAVPGPDPETLGE